MNVEIQHQFSLRVSAERFAAVGGQPGDSNAASSRVRGDEFSPWDSAAEGACKSKASALKYKAPALFYKARQCDYGIDFTELSLVQPIVEALMGSRVKARILHWLYVEADPAQPVTERGLARHTGVSAGSIHSALMSLVEGQLVVRESTPQGPQYRAPYDDPRLKPLFQLLRQDSEIVKQLKRALKPFNTIGYACVFGSFARGETRKGSDIDVLVLERTDDRLAIMAALSKLSDKIHREISPQFYDIDEFKGLIEKREPIALSILGNVRIELKGTLSWET